MKEKKTPEETLLDRFISVQIGEYSYNWFKEWHDRTYDLKETNQLLEAKILQFRQKILKDKWIKMPYRYNEDFLKEFDEHFDIKIERLGDVST